MKWLLGLALGNLCCLIVVGSCLSFIDSPLVRLIALVVSTFSGLKAVALVVMLLTMAELASRAQELVLIYYKQELACESSMELMRDFQLKDFIYLNHRYYACLPPFLHSCFLRF